MEFSKVVSLFVGLVVAGCLANSNVEFRLSARNLTAFDPLGGYPDPYVNVTYENPPLAFAETEKLVDTQNPEWSNVFNVIHVNTSGTSSQRLVLDVYDEDYDSDDLMGTVVVQLDDLVNAFGGVLERDIVLNNDTVNGQLVIRTNITSA